MKKIITLGAALVTICIYSSCTLLRTDMVPKPVFSWDKRAVQQRIDDRAREQYLRDWKKTNNITK